VAVQVDVRGRGDSEGTFQPCHSDGPDGFDVIGWAAGQDWCTGDVATYGGSYGGHIQWLAALGKPRACVRWSAWSRRAIRSSSYRFSYVDGQMPQYRDDVDWAEIYWHRALMTRTRLPLAELAGRARAPTAGRVVDTATPPAPDWRD